MKSPLVSIIITTKNEAANLPGLLNSITKQTYRPLETIIVDNHSQDTTVAIAKKYTKLVFTRGPERSTQRNYGARLAHCKYLLFLDADMELTPHTISESVKKMKNKHVVGVVISEDVKITNFFSKIKRLEKHLYRGELTLEAARFVHRAAFVKIGGYNTSLVAGEDWDISNRLSKKGKIARIRHTVYHQGSSWQNELLKKQYYASFIQKYAKLHPKEFSCQSGKARLKLFWRKRHLLVEHPIIGVSLLALKAVEYLLFLKARIIQQGNLHYTT